MEFLARFEPFARKVRTFLSKGSYLLKPDHRSFSSKPSVLFIKTIDGLRFLPARRNFPMCRPFSSKGTTHLGKRDDPFVSLGKTDFPRGLIVLPKTINPRQIGVPILSRKSTDTFAQNYRYSSFPPARRFLPIG